MSSDLPRRNRFSLFRAKRLFFRPLRPFVFRRPRPLFRPTFPPDARSASVCNLISAMRGIALPRIRVYLYIYRYRVLPPALLLFDHAAGIYIRLRVLFPAARVCCCFHPGIAPRPVSFDMFLIRCLYRLFCACSITITPPGYIAGSAYFSPPPA